MNIERGTNPYLAPEIILEGKLNYATMDDIDIWALGMTFFAGYYLDVEFPYEMELNSSSEKAPDLAPKFENLLKEMIGNKSKPQSSKKYQQRQLKEWSQLDKLYNKCTAFGAFLRPSAEDVLREKLKKNQREPVWKRKLITKSSIAKVKETQVVVRMGEARDLHTAFLVFQLFDSYPWPRYARGRGLP